MLTASQIKTIRSLKEKKFRDALGLFVVEGEKMVQEALQSSFTVESVFRAEQIGQTAMERISLLSSPSPVLALVRKPVDKEGYTLPSPGTLCLALDGIRDPGNMGTILRIADWFAIDRVYASYDSVDIFNPKVVQSTMGALFRVDFQYCDIPSLCREKAVESFGTFLTGEDIYTGDLTSPGKASVIVIGNESNGISGAVSECCRRRITIPSFAKGYGSESLNAAVATAITVSEFKRRTL